MLLLAAVALMAPVLLGVAGVIDTVVAGLRREEPPLRWLRPVSPFITARTELLDVDRQYERLVSR